MMPLLLLVLLAAGIGFGYYKHREFLEWHLHHRQWLLSQNSGITFMHGCVSAVIQGQPGGLDIGRVSVQRVSASDASGKQCPWRSHVVGSTLFGIPLSDSGGPALIIEIDPDGAKDVLTASGEFRYRGKIYSFEAQWKQETAGGQPWGTVMWREVSCTIQPPVFPPEGENP
jgi:hypothetical protein